MDLENTVNQKLKIYKNFIDVKFSDTIFGHHPMIARESE